MDSWTTSQVETLERLYKAESIGELSTKLNRTPNSIYKKARRLGFSGIWSPHKDVWVWYLSRRFNVFGLLAVIGPYLTAKKEAAYKAVRHVSS